MLRYLNQGLRDEKETNWHPDSAEICRGNWEIMVIVAGAACPVVSGGPVLEFREQQLWVLSPLSIHTWKRDPSRPCEVVVAHFACLHSIVENFISKTSPTSVRLAPSDIKKVREIYDRLLPHYQHPTLSSLLVFEQAMLDFCLLILKNMQPAVNIRGFDAHSTKVHQALVWYQEHLPEGVDVRSVAAALNVTPTHLRRLFQSVMQDTPKQVFRRIALEKSCRLMVETGLSLKEIAFLCGYKGFNQFHRAFHEQYQRTPEEWRRNTSYKSLGIRSEALCSTGRHSRR